MRTKNFFEFQFLQKPGIRIIFLLLLIIPMAGSVNAQTIPSVNWMRMFGSPTGDMSQSVSARQDIYLTGQTVGAFPGWTFDGTYFDPWTAKFNASGDLIWTDQYGTGGSEVGYAIVDDASGVYSVGIINGAFPNQTSFGLQDMYLRKTNHDGVIQWTRQFGTEGYEMIPGAITVDATGVYTCGKTSGSFPGFTFAGSEDLFIIKYSLEGDFLWCRQVGTDMPENCTGVYADNTGLYICGASYGPVYGLTNIGYNDALIAKYTTDGDLVWAHLFGTVSNDAAYEICGDESGLYVSGSTAGIFPGYTYGGGGNDAFVAKFDRDGNQIWVKQTGTAGTDYGYGVSLNTSGVFVVGTTTGTFPGQNTAIGNDIFVLGYNKAGDQLWVKQFGSTQRPGTVIVPQDYGYSISVVSLTAYITGYSNGVYAGVPGAGSSDALVIELLVQTPPEATQDLIVEVGFLQEAGILNQGQANSLIVKLQNSIVKMSQGKYNTAINILNAFINEVTDLNVKGILPDKDAEDLIIAAGRVISELEKLLLKQGNVNEIANKVADAYTTCNYPNPFSSSTTISYILPEEVNVTLKVFDSRGKEVTSMDIGMQNAGTHTVTFNSADLVNGLYYYRLQAGNYQATRKMVLVR